MAPRGTLLAVWLGIDRILQSHPGKEVWTERNAVGNVLYGVGDETLGYINVLTGETEGI